MLFLVWTQQHGTLRTKLRWLVKWILLSSISKCYLFYFEWTMACLLLCYFDLFAWKYCSLFPYLHNRVAQPWKTVFLEHTWHQVTSFARIICQPQKGVAERHKKSQLTTRFLNSWVLFRKITWVLKGLRF